MTEKLTVKKKMTVKKGLSSDSIKSLDSIVSYINLQQNDMLDNRYEIIEEIGRGGFSVVYKAFDKKQDEIKALKVFGKYLDLNTILSELQNEAKLQMNLNHPNIAKVNEFHETEYVFLDMEFIDGQSLSNKIKNKKIIKQDKFKYAIQIVKAMQEAHDNFIAHLDLKPDNIMIDKQNHVKIIDFGLAKIKESQINSSDQYAGTPEYSAPESFDDKIADTQKDIFAFGITLYELFYYKYPFGLNEERVPDYAIPKHILKSKKPIDKIIKHCLQYFAEDRYQNFTEILNNLEEALIKKPSFIKTLPMRIYSHLPRFVHNPNVKKELRYLLIILIALLILLPFYLIAQKQSSMDEKTVEIDAPSYMVFQNDQYKGIAPVNLTLKKGDQLQFIDDNGETALDYTYNGEKEFKVDYKSKKVFLNKKQIGQIIEHKNDLPLKANLAFINSKIRLSAKDFKRQKHPRLNLKLSNNSEDIDLGFLPKNLHFLNLKNNHKIRLLTKLNKNLKLKGLDLENTKVDYHTLNKLPQLERLNLKQTDIKDLNFIRKDNKLKHLSLKHTRIKSIKPLRDTKIENLTIDSDSLESIAPLLNMPYLNQVDLNNSPDSLDTGFNNLLSNKLSENQVKVRQIISKSNHNQRIIFYIILFIVSMLMSACIFLILKIIFKKMPKITSDPLPPQIESPDKKEPEKLKKKNYGKRDIDYINTAIYDKRLYSPPNENALYVIHSLLKDNSEDELLLNLKKQTLKAIEDKIKLHQERMEYEPVFLAANGTNEFFPDKKMTNNIKNSSKKLIKNSKLKMIKVRSGEYNMGDYTNPAQANGNKLHKVMLDTFYISQTTVTNSQFCEFLNALGNQKEYGSQWFKEDSPYAQIACVNGQYYPKIPYGDFPVYEVNWFGAKKYCEWKGGRLPSEAEWEFCARARGEEIMFACGNEVDKTKANYLIDINDTLWHSVFPVKSFKPNKLKLYEMCGNILEWCEDWYDKYYYNFSPESNPLGPDGGDMKVVRGGAWCFDKEHMKTFYRGSAKPLTRNNFIGFRIVIPK